MNLFETCYGGKTHIPTIKQLRKYYDDKETAHGRRNPRYLARVLALWHRIFSDRGQQAMRTQHLRCNGVARHCNCYGPTQTLPRLG